MNRRSFLAMLGFTSTDAELVFKKGMRASRARSLAIARLGIDPVVGPFAVTTAFLDAHGPVGLGVQTNAPLEHFPTARIDEVGKQGSAACAVQDRGNGVSAHVEQVGKDADGMGRGGATGANPPTTGPVPSAPDRPRTRFRCDADSRCWLAGPDGWVRYLSIEEMRQVAEHRRLLEAAADELRRELTVEAA